MSLRDEAAKSARDFGTAVGYDQGYAIYNEAEYAAIADAEFSLIQCENEMKLYALQPSAGVFSFATADQYVARAQANNQKVFGQVLCWAPQLPAWLTGGGYSAAQIQAILQNHITTVIQHFGTNVYAWDVVNEAVDGGFWADAFAPEDPEDLRPGYQMMTAAAFGWARAANPNVRLYYNDYAFEFGGTRADAIYTLLSTLKAGGTPIDGLGFQCHFTMPLTAGQITALTTQLQRFAALGLDLQITELDIARNGYSLAAQAQAFYDVVNAACQVPAVKAISTWGFTDKYTWRAGTEPLLYDASYAPKAAYDSVLQALADNPERTPPVTTCSRPSGTYPQGTTLTLSATDALSPPVTTYYRWR